MRILKAYLGIIGLIISLAVGAQSNESENFKSLLSQMDACLSKGNDCHALSDSIHDLLRSTPNDSLAGKYLVRLSNLRDSYGIWDEDTEKMLEEAISRYQKL